MSSITAYGTRQCWQCFEGLRQFSGTDKTQLLMLQHDGLDEGSYSPLFYQGVDS